MKVRYTLTAPMSHIGETASTGAYFQTVMTSYGKLPVVTGNSIRGTVRDHGAMHLLDQLGAKVDKEVFHVLFSGGNLSESMKNDLEKARLVRERFPIISVLGGGLGDMILSGKSQFSFAYPVCRESRLITGVEADISWHSLIEEIDFTRTDDSKDDRLAALVGDMEESGSAKASTQMRYTVQYMAAGTELVQDIRLMGCNDLELGAIYAAIRKWFADNPVLGGMSGKGFGRFDAEIDGGITLKNGRVEVSDEWDGLIGRYESFLEDNDIAQSFPLLKGGKKGGKKADRAPKSNSDPS